MSPTPQRSPRRQTSEPPAGPHEPEHPGSPGRGAAPAGSSAQVTVDVRHSPRRPLLVVAGELDVASAPLVTAMIDHLQADGAARVEVDLSQVTFADSHGLQPLLDRPVTLRAVSPAVARVRQLLTGRRTPARAVIKSTPAPRPGRPARPPRVQGLASPVPDQRGQHHHVGYRGAARRCGEAPGRVC